MAQKLLYKQLTRLGFQVQMTNNGLEAVEVWLSRPAGYFKMGFFDHHMPLVRLLRELVYMMMKLTRSCHIFPKV